LKSALLECLNEALAGGRPPRAEWLGDLVRFLQKPGGDSLQPGIYRLVCLLKCTYKVLSAILKDRLHKLC